MFALGYWCWSSSEYSSNNAWNLNNNGNMNNNNKNNDNNNVRVRAFAEFVLHDKKPLHKYGRNFLPLFFEHGRYDELDSIGRRILGIL